jgi:hypothetical protein
VSVDRYDGVHSLLQYTGSTPATCRLASRKYLLSKISRSIQGQHSSIYCTTVLDSCFKLQKTISVGSKNLIGIVEIS